MRTQSIHSILLICFVLLSVTAFADDKEVKSNYSVKGKVKSTSNKEPVSFCTVEIEKLNTLTIADVDGGFVLNRIPKGEYILTVTSIGHADKQVKINVNKNLELVVLLDEVSIALPEFQVMAKKTGGDKITIGESAIEYLQPTSLADVMLLLPGSTYKENDMTSFSGITSRQAGSDSNTSLGVAIVSDGAPISADGNRTQMIGLTSGSSTSSDTQITSRTGMNQGVDMRYLSTDHVQSIEFAKGISSAQYGNLTGGTVQVQSKYGITPLQARVKVDLKNKLAYVGKGFKLSDTGGTLHLGVDYLHSSSDPRDELDKFTRLTAQAYYNNKIKLGETILDLDVKLSQTVSLQKMKKDELAYEYDETYKADYNKTALLIKGNLNVNRSWLDKLEMFFSSDVTFDKITRHKVVISGTGATNVPLAKEEGEHEGIYLPTYYYSDYYVENIPLNIFTQLNATSRFSLGEHFHTNFFYGLEYKNTKNHGDGAVIKDETRPPFPRDNSYMRPRPNYEIPAISIGAAYLQTEFLYTSNKHNLKLSPGVRITKMFNLPNDYTLADKVLLEPRANLFYTFYGDKIKNTLRLGYGVENKLPTMDYLYPEKVYKDFYMLNSYANEPEYRRLITYTKIYDSTNKELRENKNKKIELGWDVEYKGFNLSLTAFYEKSKSGFEYFSIYSPVTFDYYNTNNLKPGVDISGRLPEKDDFEKTIYSLYTTYSQVRNSKTVDKRGLEYRLQFPKIQKLKTDIEINGAYYKTNYGSNEPEYYYYSASNLPGFANGIYPYVGIYDTNPDYEYRQFNTNIWINTHIPKYKLIFTNFFQIVWKSTSQDRSRKEVYPIAYLDFNGNVNQVTQELRDKMDAGDPNYRHLKKSINSLNYTVVSKPVSFLWNIKAMKEFSQHIRLSFFVNGILDVTPYYTVKGEKYREWKDPFFGFELLLNFNL